MVANPVGDVGSLKVSRPSHITVLRKRRFAAGRGRRNSDSSRALAYPYGSLTWTSSNSAPAWGMPIPTRISPRSSKSAYAWRRACTVDTSARGDTEPSLGRKRGSVPRLSAKRSCALVGVRVIPTSGSWQVWHDRPLVPSDWKKGFVGSSSGPPLAFIVSEKPERFTE